MNYIEAVYEQVGKMDEVVRKVVKQKGSVADKQEILFNAAMEMSKVLCNSEINETLIGK